MIRTVAIALFIAFWLSAGAFGASHVRNWGNEPCTPENAHYIDRCYELFWGPRVDSRGNSGRLLPTTPGGYDGSP